MPGTPFVVDFALQRSGDSDTAREACKGMVIETDGEADGTEG